MNKDMPPTDAARRVALIRSVVAFAERRDLADVLDEVQDILDGADIDELMMRRAVR